MEKKNNQTQISEYIRAAAALGRRFEGQKSSAGVFQSSSPCPIPPSSANAKSNPRMERLPLTVPEVTYFPESSTSGSSPMWLQLFPRSSESPMQR